jgi:hypothetical protein
MRARCIALEVTLRCIENEEERHAQAFYLGDGRWNLPPGSIAVPGDGVDFSIVRGKSGPSFRLRSPGFIFDGATRFEFGEEFQRLPDHFHYVKLPSSSEQKTAEIGCSYEYEGCFGGNTRLPIATPVAASRGGK